MKNKRLPNGPGDLVIDQLLGSMIAQLGGSCINEPGGLRLSIPGDLSSEFVRYAPTTQRAWTTRLKWVEKQSAIFLLNSPILYGVTWSGAGGKRSGNDGLRLSVGLSLSIGRPLPKRYTCLIRHGRSEIRVSEGGYLLLRMGKESNPTGLPPWAEADLSKLARGVLTACEYFRARPDVQHAIVELGAERRTELTDLERLYKTKQGSNDRLYGLAASGTEGSASIEAESRKLQSVVLRRYDVTVRVRVLTLGILEGCVPLEIYQTGKLVRA